MGLGLDLEGTVFGAQASELQGLDENGPRASPSGARSCVAQTMYSKRPLGKWKEMETV